MVPGVAPGKGIGRVHGSPQSPRSHRLRHASAIVALAASALLLCACGRSSVASADASARLFTSPRADWIYSAPGGSGIDITDPSLRFTFATTDNGDGRPVEFTDGTHGVTIFTASFIEGAEQRELAVPNPPMGYHPSSGNEGRLIIVNTATRQYYDFRNLRLTADGRPETAVDQIATGNLDTSDGGPGTTAAGDTALAGVIMPGELDCEDCLHHAIMLSIPRDLEYDPLGVGARLRFDAAVDVDSLPASVAIKAVMKAMQRYGAVIADRNTGETVEILTDLPHRPDDRGMEYLARYLQPCD
jgi:hypothetical protein